MDKELEKAIEIVENFGGFVLFPSSYEEEKEIRQRTFDMEKEEDIKAEEQKMADAKEALELRNDFLKRKKEAFREMNRMFYRDQGPGLTTMADLEDVLLDNGVDLDYLEEWIESQV